ncbi:MAG TPA: methyltransferase domain-containing protein [Vicinamibacterales bacterium]|nr:methyltransferase domain-containing protein [Vicinamibacterales bacterium]
MPTHHEQFAAWIAALETRQLAELTFREVSRSLRALSSTYVERRGRLGEGAALSGAGKRAAFALFYAPLHYLLVREIVQALPGATDRAPALIDLGCGTGAAGAAWAAACERSPAIVGVDRHPWALGEADWTYRQFGLAARTRQEDVARATLPKSPALLLAAFTVNELPDAARDAVLRRLFERAAGGDRVLIIEPLARGVAPWWNRWQDAAVAAGGRGDEWRFRVELPAIVTKLDRAAGLNHRELTGRSLWLGGPPPTPAGGRSASS